MSDRRLGLHTRDKGASSLQQKALATRAGCPGVAHESDGGVEAFPKDSELACVAAGRVAGLRAGTQSDTGRLKRALQSTAWRGLMI